MILLLEEEKFEFDFPKAKALYKFDERDINSPNYHSAPMKAVDVVAEFDKFQLWIEIKEFPPHSIKAMQQTKSTEADKQPKYNKAHLTENLKYKFRDTFLYRLCEDKTIKAIVYICLTNFDDALNGYFRKELQRQIPAGQVSRNSDKHLIAKSQVYVVNKEAWNRNFAAKFGTCRKIV
ncbi:MAG: hypothetical protein SOY91_06730 [Candidatus Onthomorpha sp.]|nr:hypothetical protein [Candidatus Onthomorpha sp.]